MEREGIYDLGFIIYCVLSDTSSRVAFIFYSQFKLGVGYFLVWCGRVLLVVSLLLHPKAKG